jgi:LysM repeat protein
MPFAAAPAPCPYKTQAGDTLYAIAMAVGIGLADIQAYNPTYSLRVGLNESVTIQMPDGVLCPTGESSCLTV